MRRLIATVMLLLCLGMTGSILIPTTATAGGYEEECATAAKFGWNSAWANLRCLFAMMCEVGGPGPDGMW